jgi:integrase
VNNRDHIVTRSTPASREKPRRRLTRDSTAWRVESAANRHPSSRPQRAHEGAEGRTRLHGLFIQERPKTDAGRRTIPLPPQTLDLLWRRLAQLPTAAEPPVVFPSPKGLLHDPTNTSGDLRKARDRAGFSWATSHTFRRTVATRLDDAGLSARQIADHLGHSGPSLTQDAYLGRGTASPRTAAAIRRAL